MTKLDSRKCFCTKLQTSIIWTVAAATTLAAMSRESKKKIINEGKKQMLHRRALVNNNRKTNITTGAFNKRRLLKRGQTGPFPSLRLAT
jgi:hypothetical protein